MNGSTEKKDQHWLQKLKEESWEAELLISTVAIFGTIQLFKLIDWATIIAIDRLPPSQYIVGYGIVFLGLLAVSILTTMFIVHFLLRAYWVGLVGLNSVFPDYSIEDSAYSEIYTRKMLSILPRLKKTIKDVNELSSVIFSSAFFMLMIYVNFSLVICLLLVLYNLLLDRVPQIILYFPVILFGVLLVLSIIISVLANVKAYKENEPIQNWYFKVSKWSSMIMMGPLYVYMLQISMTFGSNFKKKKSLIGLTIATICIGFIIAMVQFNNSRIPYLIRYESTVDTIRSKSEFYADRDAAHEFLVTPQIDHDIIESDMTRLFIPIFSYEKKMFNNICGAEPETRDERKKWFFDCYHNYHLIVLDGDTLTQTFRKYNLPETGQFGIITYLDLEGKKNGGHVLQVSKNLKESVAWEIPFQRVRRR